MVLLTNYQLFNFQFPIGFVVPYIDFTQMVLLVNYKLPIIQFPIDFVVPYTELNQMVLLIIGNWVIKTLEIKLLFNHQPKSLPVNIHDLNSWICT